MREHHPYLAEDKNPVLLTTENSALNGSCVSTFRLGSRVLQPETFEMRQ